MSTPGARDKNLDKVFLDAVHGRRELGPRQYHHFLEGICIQPVRSICIGKLVGSPNAMDLLNKAMCHDLKPAFCNGLGAKVLKYLASDGLSVIGEGQILKSILLRIVQPAHFWHALVQALRGGELDDKGKFGAAWLLFTLIDILPHDDSAPFREVALEDGIIELLDKSADIDVRNLAAKLKHRNQIHVTAPVSSAETGPGGRHDNDFVDFREVAVIPSADEIRSTQPAFIRPSTMFDDDENYGQRQAVYLDNQFRLLREDMLYEIRDELQALVTRKKNRNFVLDGLTLHDVHYLPTDPQKKRGVRWGIVLKRGADFRELKQKNIVDTNKRKKWFMDNRNVLKHLSVAYLANDQEIIALTTIERDEDFLVRTPPEVVLHIEGAASTVHALVTLKSLSNIQLIQLNTAIFAYQPILQALQETKEIPLTEAILFWKLGAQPKTRHVIPHRIINSLQNDPTQDLRPILKTNKPIRLDASQGKSLLEGLTKELSLIQGPPGTGKSFIGALIAKALHDFGGQRILLVCYTNHALDQFLEDLMDIGIPHDSMVRLGGKSTTRTESLSLNKIQNKDRAFKFTWGDRAVMQDLETKIRYTSKVLSDVSTRYKTISINSDSIMTHLEFFDEEYYDAFQIPDLDDGDGLTVVDKRGKGIGKFYLLIQWRKGFDAGLFKAHNHALEFEHIWAMPKPARDEKVREWMEAILKDLAQDVNDRAREYNKYQTELDAKREEKVGHILRSKQIVACTTTAAAKYRDHITSAKLDVLMVEEAGEILECHIVTALSQSVKQLILIGDHKQLRPKVNNYKLTVEKGDGFDLNRSMFERLVLKGYPHVVLQAQHRMRPDISKLVRHLTYPDLVDAPGTQGRADIRGLQNNVVFIQHSHPEDDLIEYNHFDNKNDETSHKSSKRNQHEVEMVLKIVRYLGQQGYRTDEIVILTPYLGQLRALQNALKKDNDPILGDLDSADLVKAGLMTSAAAELVRRPIRLATIDNYQGEESLIPIISLTRSNSDRKIGFMASPERVNVLLSRAKDGIIMIGNAQTFIEAKAPHNPWPKLFDLLQKDGHVYDGLPVRCERHPKTTAVLRHPDDFDAKAPDGGCTEPCDAFLQCGHNCPSSCHQISDHSKMNCQQIMPDQCPKGHRREWVCHEGPPKKCRKCAEDLKAAEKQQRQAFKAQEQREREQRAHDQRMAEINARIAEQESRIREKQLAEERERAIQLRQRDLDDLINASVSISRTPGSRPASPRSSSPTSTSTHLSHSGSSAPSSTTPSPAKQVPSAPKQARPSISGLSARAPSAIAAPAPVKKPTPSPSEQEWKRQKEIEGARNPVIDEIMDLGGLEMVKKQLLEIKDRVEVAKRQGLLLKQERFSASLLGNPGTGKTTVARLYGRFLTSLGVIEGTTFVETTGSKMASQGVDQAKKQIEQLLNAGGGILFLDEAYQIVDSGRQVLDYLLAEIENQRGKIVFLFAGYSREMEKFFEHNPGLPSRVPYTLQFEDYSDEVLMDILEKMIRKKFNGHMKVDDPDGVRGLHGRIAVRRLGQGRGRPGFGNVRALEIAFGQIHSRQSSRLSNLRKQGVQADQYLLTKEDLIGPDPSTVIAESKAWKKLQGMIGLESVKQSVLSFMKMVKTNYERELKELKPQEVSLNRVLLGNPGTGKTTVAKLYGQILADLGLLSNGEVVVKNPSDFVGSALGESEKQTKAIIATTAGKVLVIDEAYMLYPGEGTNDPYKTAVIDTIVAEVQSTPGEDRCVLLTGYRDKMENMFQNVNPGLSRRFAIENAFEFADYDDDELLKALEWKLKDQDLTATPEAKKVAIDVLSRQRNRPNFGNIGAVENLLSMAKTRMQRRIIDADAPFEPGDFDPDYLRSQNASENLTKLFEDTIGSERTVAQLRRYQNMAENCRARNIDPREMIPTNFVFKGPPGTGKTTTARKMGQVYFDMGFLASAEVVECATSDLIGQYVGQTGPKTRAQLDKALGRVLFIDEAYRFANGDHFAGEAVDELVSCLTQERYKGKLIVILAGYDHEMNDLLKMNPGLSSRFTEEVIFSNMNPADGIRLIARDLSKRAIVSEAFEDETSDNYCMAHELLERLSKLPSWGNARDLKVLATQMITHVFTTSVPTSSKGQSVISAQDTLDCIFKMLDQKTNRESSQPKPVHQPLPDAPMAPPPSAPTPPRTKTTTGTREAPAEPERPKATAAIAEGRDPGVSDAIWAQLQADKKAEECAQREDEESRKALEDSLGEAERLEREQAIKVERIIDATKAAKDDDERKELMRQREQARLRERAMAEQKARMEEALKRQKEEEQRKRREEAKVQQKIRDLGICPAGFRWIKQANGYRCGGGAHFLSNAELGI